jgi:hypothetical protein
LTGLVRVERRQAPGGAVDEVLRHSVEQLSRRRRLQHCVDSSYHRRGQGEEGNGASLDVRHLAEHCFHAVFQTSDLAFGSPPA